VTETFKSALCDQAGVARLFEGAFDM
jgi:hypothetical protein